MNKLKNRPDYTQILERIAIDSSIPCLLSRADGSIVWCNNAFEEFIGYTVAEFHAGKVGWKQLTPIKEELLADEEMVSLLQSGQRTEYTIYKSYLPNGKSPTRCKLTVYAWPSANGQVEEFVVVVWPLINGQLMAFEHTVSSVEKLRQEIGGILKTISDRDRESDIIQGARLAERWLVKYPVGAKIVGLLLLIVVLGDKGAELVIKLLKALGWLQSVDVPQVSAILEFWHVA